MFEKSGEEGSSFLPTPRQVRRGVEDLMEKVFGEAGMFSGSRLIGPDTDIYETDDSYVVEAELPGMDQNDFDIKLAGDLLTIRGEKKHEFELKEENFQRIERSFGSFSRSFVLPCLVEEDKVNAEYKNGVLRLTLPKVEACRKQPVKITVH